MVSDVGIRIRGESNTESAFRQTNAQMKLLESRLGRVDRTSVGASRRLSGVTSASRNMGFAIQNVGYQVQDIIVQLNSGTSASRALGQQLPQLLSGFGLLGVLAGTAAAALVPLASGFLDGSEEAKEAADRVKDFTERLESARSTVAGMADDLDLLRSGLENAFERTFAEAVDLRQVELSRAETLLRGALTRQQGSFGDGPGLSRAQVQAQVDAARERVIQARIELESARELQRQTKQRERDEATINGLHEARQIIQEREREQREAIARGLAATIGPARTVRNETQAHVEEMVKVFENAKKMREQLGDAVFEALRLSGVDMTSGIEDAVDAAKRLSKELGVGLETAAKLRAQGRGGPDGEVIFDPRDPAFDPVAAALARANNPERRIFENEPTRRTSGGGGTSAPEFEELSEAARAAERLISEAKRAAVEYGDVQSELKARLEAGTITQQQYNASIDLAKEAYTNASEEAKFFDLQQQNLKDGILDAIVAGDDLADTFDNVGRAIQRAALEAAIFGSGPLSGAFGGTGGGVVGSLVNGLLGGFGATTQASTAAAGLPSVFNSSGDIALPNFDGGGFTGSGPRTGGVDGRGGFPTILHPNETVIDHTRGGSARPVVNNIRIEAPPGSDIREDRRQNATGGEDLTILIDKAVSGLARDPGSQLSRTLGSNFGIKPTTRGR